jgi:PilZ domain
MLIHSSLALQGSGSRDWLIPRRKEGREPNGHRQAIRFPIKLSARYQAGVESGWGEIVNISSKGALFTTDRALALNACVEVYIKWPLLLHDSVQLSLIASGTVTRIEPGRAAFGIEKYEFRTCVPTFFQPWWLPGRVVPAPQTSSEYQMSHLQVRDLRTPGAAGWLEGRARRLTSECTSPERRAGRQARIEKEIPKNRHQRKGEDHNAHLERIFQERFADPEYYCFRLLPHSSPKVDV